MRLTFLGTAAAECYPNAFCRCANCERARALGGPSLRKRSAALIHDDLLIDLGPDVVSAAFLHGHPLTRLRICLQTHAHDDHLDPSLFLSRSPAYGVPDAPRLHFYASDATLRRIAQLLEADFPAGGFLCHEVGESLNLTLHPVQAYEQFRAGPYRIVAYPAEHDPSVAPLLYAIEAGGRAIFYGTDTAPLSEATWQALRQHRPRFNVVILDHTYGPDEEGTDHLNARQVVEHFARMRAEGLLADDARKFGTHIWHAGNPPHPELAAFAAQHGYEIAYDGLTV